MLRATVAQTTVSRTVSTSTRCPVGVRAPVARSVVVRLQKEGDEDSKTIMHKETSAADNWPNQLKHDGSRSPMAEDKRAISEQQGAAPDGDKPLIGEQAQFVEKKAFAGLDKATGPGKAEHSAAQKQDDKAMHAHDVKTGLVNEAP